jgi:hypothetical protein
MTVLKYHRLFIPLVGITSRHDRGIGALRSIDLETELRLMKGEAVNLKAPCIEVSRHR